MMEADLTEQIIGAAIEVHKHWGPGLYEEIYERSLCFELRLRNVAFETQVRLPLLYKDGPMSVSLLFLPLQAVRANLRLATQAVQPYMDASGDRQSLICANLLALSFHSVFPCLRGESSSAPLRVLFAAHVPTSARLISGACHVQAVGNQQATLCRHTLRTHSFC